MDQFTKLAELVGATVAPIGDGLPRSRKEALALGAKRYFTAVPCLHGHVAERMASGGRCCECRRQHDATAGRGRRRRYDATAAGEERNRQRWYQRRLSKAGDKILFAINQAEQGARWGRAPADIIAQCPEPQRGQLQALVDRIKADPRAGKAVVGLLRTMREIRKAELAELRAAA